MADPNNPTSSDSSPESTPSAAVSLLAAISEQIKGSNNTVREKVVEARVSKEIDKRADSLDKALAARSAAAGELKKLDKPDQVVYGADGKPMHEGFSKEQLKKIGEAKKKLAKIDKCINAALNENDWGKLNEVK